MATSRRVRRRPAATFAEQATALAWGAWVELGVSGWTDTHSDWAIDPEPLIVFTAFLGDEDARLRDEATDWCVRNWRYVSKTRLKNLVREQPTAVTRCFRDLRRDRGGPRRRRVAVRLRVAQVHGDGPIVGTAARQAVDGVAPAPGHVRSRCPHRDPALLPLPRRWPVEHGDHQRGHQLHQAKRRRGVRNARAGRSPERPTDGQSVLLLAGEASRARGLRRVDADHHTRTGSPIFGIARQLVGLESAAETGTTRTLAVKARSAVDEMEEDLDELEIDPPSSDLRGEDLWPAIRSSARRRSANGRSAAGTGHPANGRPVDPGSATSPDPRADEQLVLEPSPTNAPLPKLTGSEAALYKDLVEDQYGTAVRLEQGGSASRGSSEPSNRGRIPPDGCRRVGPPVRSTHRYGPSDQRNRPTSDERPMPLQWIPLENGPCWR